MSSLIVHCLHRPYHALCMHVGDAVSVGVGGEDEVCGADVGGPEPVLGWMVGSLQPNQPCE